jgi:hypothetical protein
MITATAAVLIDAAVDRPNRASSCRPGQRPEERLEHLVEQVAEEENAPIKQQRGATLPRELIGHLLRI